MKAWRIASAMVLVLAGGWVLFTFPPVTTPYYPKCVFKQVTGYDCPGCGTTRALHALLHGRVADAFHLNAMLFPLMACAVAAVPSLMRGQQPRFLSRPWFGWGSFVVIVAWWIGRNV